jgi:hypothetical protein
MAAVTAVAAVAAVAALATGAAITTVISWPLYAGILAASTAAARSAVPALLAILAGSAIPALAARASMPSPGVERELPENRFAVDQQVRPVPAMLPVLARAARISNRALAACPALAAVRRWVISPGVAMGILPLRATRGLRQDRMGCAWHAIGASRAIRSEAVEVPHNVAFPG